MFDKSLKKKKTLFRLLFVHGCYLFSKDYKNRKLGL